MYTVLNLAAVCNCLKDQCGRVQALKEGMLLMFSYKQRLKSRKRHQFVVLYISFLFLSSLLFI